MGSLMWDEEALDLSLYDPSSVGISSEYKDLLDVQGIRWFPPVFAESQAPTAWHQVLRGTADPLLLYL